MDSRNRKFNGNGNGFNTSQLMASIGNDNNRARTAPLFHRTFIRPDTFKRFSALRQLTESLPSLPSYGTISFAAGGWRAVSPSRRYSQWFNDT
jgi:hypothetical protein